MTAPAGPDESTAAELPVDLIKRRARWRHRRDGRIDVFLGGARRRRLAAAAAMAVVMAVHIGYGLITNGPWLWLAAAVDLAAVIVLVRSALRWPTYLTITDLRLTARLGLLRRIDWGLRSISVIATGAAARVRTGDDIEYLDVSVVELRSSSGRLRIRLRHRAESDELVALLARRTRCTPVPITQAPAADGSPIDLVKSAVSPSPATVLGILVVFTALFSLTTLVLVADRSPAEPVVAAEALLADLRADARALPANDTTGDAEVEVGVCEPELELMRPDPVTWEISVSTERTVAPDVVQIEWWSDAVNRALGSDGVLAVIDRSGYRVGMPGYGDRRSVWIETECVAGSADQRDEVVRALSSLAARIVAVEARPRELDNVRAELDRAAAKLPEATVAGNVVRSPRVVVEECEEAEGRPPAYRIAASVRRDVGSPTFDDRPWLNAIGERFGKSALDMRSFPSFRGDGFFVSLDFDDSEIVATATTDCAIGDKRDRAAARVAAADLLVRVVALHGRTP